MSDEFWGEERLEDLAKLHPNPEGELKWARVIVPIDPTAKGRPRSMATSAGVRTYTPAKTRQYEALARSLLSEQLGELLITEPTMLAIDFFLRRPKRLYRKKDPDGPVVHGKKPDKDNLMKSLLDSLKYHLMDDSLVFASIERKLYCPKDAAPRIEILLAWYEPSEE